MESTATTTMPATTVLRTRWSSHHHQRNGKQLLHAQ